MTIINRFKRFLSLVKKFFKIQFASPVSYAFSLGVKLGEDVFIADNACWSTEPFLITIGSHCQITSGVRFITHGGGQAARRLVPDMDTFGKIVVGDYVYIGTNSLIMPGVIIGDDVLIAAGSVVTKSVPSGVVVGGNPASIICTIEEYVERNQTYNIHTKGLSHDEKVAVLKSLNEESFIKKRIMTR